MNKNNNYTQENKDELFKLADEIISKSNFVSLDDFDHSKFNPKRVIDLGLNKLFEIKHSDMVVYVAGDYPNNSNRYTYKKPPFEFYKIIKKLNEIEGDGFYFPSGFYYYPPNGACGWHTNANLVGKRVYLTYAEEENKSFFRYYDSEKDEIVTKYDKKGWNINSFNVENNNDGGNCFWHCVGSNTNRISLGFRLVKNTHFFEDKIDLYEEYYRDLSNNLKYEKTNNMYKNFLYGKFYHTIPLNWEPFKNISHFKFVLNLIHIDYIFNKHADVIPISEIYWENKYSNTLQFHEDIDTEFPVILYIDYDNQYNLKYKVIDGNERLSKALFHKKETIKAYTIHNYHIGMYSEIFNA
tara:strand:+ start:24486 stop:25544 length:1059 start_codon:yes stop_codon:yes gene_type:complete